MLFHELVCTHRIEQLSLNKAKIQQLEHILYNDNRGGTALLVIVEGKALHRIS